MKILTDGVKGIASNSYIQKNKSEYKKQDLAADKVEISMEAQKLMSESSDVRLDKVNEIKSLIDNGTYKVSSSDLANKMLEDIKLYSKFISEKE